MMVEHRIPCLDYSKGSSTIGIRPDHENSELLLLDTGYEGVSYMTKQQAAFFALKLLSWVSECN